MTSVHQCYSDFSFTSLRSSHQSHASRTQGKLPLRRRCFHRPVQHARAIPTLHVLHLPQSRWYGGFGQPRSACAHVTDHQRQSRHLVCDSLIHSSMFVYVSDCERGNRIYKAVLSGRGTPEERRASSERHFCSKCSAMLWLWDETWYAANSVYQTLLTQVPPPCPAGQSICTHSHQLLTSLI